VTKSIEDMELVGRQLLELVMPMDVQAELRVENQFLELGIDEALLEFPWELMHDGDEFMCLKHLMGRFVNVTRPSIPPRERQEAARSETLSVLLISVPRPQPRSNGTVYEPLPAAEAEAKAIVETLAPLGDAVTITLLRGRDATWDNTFKAIKAGPYHIVHFNGHAYFNSERPQASSLVLFDRDLATGPIMSFFGRRPPLFFVMNACETAAIQSAGATWKDRYDIFGLARAFLETGAYLVGTRWKVGDEAAAAFATAFYSSFVSDLKSLGRAIRDGRLASRKASPDDDLSWASYLLYGDPRVRLLRT
jgi:CHAT domain-containing protein